MSSRKLSSLRNRTPRLSSIDEETIEERQEKEEKARQELEERNKFWREIKEEAAAFAKELAAIEEKEKKARKNTGLAGYKRKSKRHKKTNRRRNRCHNKSTRRRRRKH